MAFKEFKFLDRASDLLIGHLDFNYSNDEANITPPAAGAVVKFGSVVFRAKGLGKAAPWTVVSAAADVDLANEFSVVWGDGYAYAQDFVPRAIAANRFNSVVVKRDAQFKEFYIKEVHSALSAADFDKLKQLMADQGLLVLQDDSKFVL